MNCPVCDRSLAPTLSICPSCGAMMFDSVREELQSKVTSGRLTKKVALVEQDVSARGVSISEPSASVASAPIARVSTVSLPVAVERNLARAIEAPVVPPSSQPKLVRRVETTDLSSPKTSPTLVGFQSKNPTIPDWRLQLQNAVQQRKGGRPETATALVSVPAPAVSAARLRVPSRLKNMGLDVDVEAGPRVVTTPNESTDLRVANAMRRINESRQKFLEKETKAIPAPKAAAPKVHRLELLSGSPATPAQPNAAASQIKPRLVTSAVVTGISPVAVTRDTNKLPPIMRDRTRVAVDEENEIEETSKSLSGEFGEIKRIRIASAHHDLDEAGSLEVESEEIEDLAHVSMRFGAGLFDLIISSFVGLVLLSPVLFTRDGWFSPAGLLTFAGVNAVVMFVYMTICLGFYGKTMGMRLFSLELVDAVENQYPTLHQAAVNSSVYILSLIFGGLGFLTMLFNEEKRAAHDLLSGTILVREF